MFVKLMLTEKLIDINIIPISKNDSGLRAITIMEQLNINHLPVIDKKKFIGTVSEDDIWNMNNQKSSLGSIINKLNKTHVSIEQDVFEIVKLVNEHNLTMIPVVNNNIYIGGITHKKIIKSLASIVAMQSDGGVIILEMNKNNYSMTEMAQIIESNNAKILSSYISDHHEKSMLKVTLKLNIKELAPIVQAFERYNYIVTAHYNSGGKSDNLKERYDSLMRYLNI